MECPYCKESNYEYIKMREQEYWDGVEEQYWECECQNCKKSFIIKEVHVMVVEDCESITMDDFNKGNY